MRWTAHVWITVIDLLSGVATPVVRSSGIVLSSLMKRPPAQKAASGAVWLTSSLTLAMLCGAYSKEADRMIDMLDTIYLRGPTARSCSWDVLHTAAPALLCVASL